MRDGGKIAKKKKDDMGKRHKRWTSQKPAVRVEANGEWGAARAAMRNQRSERHRDLGTLISKEAQNNTMRTTKGWIGEHWEKMEEHEAETEVCEEEIGQEPGVSQGHKDAKASPTTVKEDPGLRQV
ncbi:hypothetical protein NDU88_006420 [Pleurodeles waltl]|uniref:Uncharacterized protein n=1 Tax=Pleurodeles waltl TaxID=8319 RepID=A0AAV7TEB0_PLEWA|nr:hypothetical protein NDU88_006420 [Pleurodeles waltl]